MIILSGQTKGGVGKSLIAANLAVCFARAGRNVLLIDADRQKTSQKWNDMRVMNSVDPNITCAALYAEDVKAKGFREKIQALRTRFDDIIIDSGGHDSRELRAAVSIADVLIAPVGATVPDIWGLSDLDEIVGQFLPANPDLVCHVVINRAPPLNIHNVVGQARSAIDEMENMQFSGVILTERPTYQAAYQEGKAAFDLDPERPAERKAIEEITSVAKLVYGDV